MLKADLHLHAKEDLRDAVKYTVKELIDHMASQGFQVIALTFHDQNYHSEEMSKYAASKNITVIPGIERTIEGAHVLIYNVAPEKAEAVKSFEDLEKLKSKNTLIIAPHPYFYICSIGDSKLRKYIKFFDAIEHSSFYQKFYNRNKKGRKTAEEYNLPIIGNTDAHELRQIGYTYSLIDSKKDIHSIIKAIKANKLKLVTEPLPFSVFFRTLFYMIFLSPIKIFKRRKPL
ncbi:PHP domain-containing protein [Candidatus Woesearchaeota archaeon]|nr:PHP domain-containing protein [Candidatus Woesearchaeota archaeon]